MNPRNITLSQLRSLQHVPGADELLEAIRANKSDEEIMRIFLRYPRLMAALIVQKWHR